MTIKYFCKQTRNRHYHNGKGFTIVELTIVIVVIAILASVTVVSYKGVTERARKTALISDLHTAAETIGAAKTQSSNKQYPTTLEDAGVNEPDDVTYTYYSSGSAFCLIGVRDSYTYHVSDTETAPVEGGCTSVAMQTITKENCSSVRTLVVDARDNHSYWIQKLADGNCWMLTNLAYAGGGTNTYGDTKTLQEGSSVVSTYTAAKYYNDTTKSNATSGFTNPSTSTDGGITGKQYGYLYNWCAAMGVQTSTSACTSASTPLPDTSVSICPAGWRLPTGGSNGEFIAFNTAVNGGLPTTSSTELMSQWMAQYAGYWHSSYGFNFEGTQGKYWSSTQYSATAASYLHIESSYVDAVGFNYKYGGQSVRCVAN